MDWERIIDAADGRPQPLAWIVDRPNADVAAALATLLLLEEAPHPAAALVAVATIPGRVAPPIQAALVAAASWWWSSPPPIQAALAPHVAPALAAWRADPHWAERALGDQAQRKLPWCVAGMVGVLRDDPAALRDAVAIVRRDGDSVDVAHCLAALGAAGWAALDADLRAALLQRAPTSAHGWVWAALDGAQRTAAAQRAESDLPFIAAQLISAIGAAAWRATDRALRGRLIAAVVRAPNEIKWTTPAWPGMTAAERGRLARAVTAKGDASLALVLLEALGVVGRGALTVEQRAALERRAMRRPDSWRVPAWRAADAGWTALTGDERAAVLAAAERNCWDVPWLLRAVGAAGWTAMSAAEQARIAGAVRGSPDALFACPPALWIALGGDDPPPPRAMPRDAADHWNAEDADADLGALPPAHQALVLALAPWRTEDATKDSARLQRLVAAWSALPDDERVAFATTHPSVLATVAAAARLCGGAAAGVDALGETLIRIVLATGGESDARQAAVRLMRVAPRWRNWMAPFAPTDDDPPEAWAAWEVAVRRGLIDDVTLCARLAAKEREESNRSRALRRA